MRWILLAAFFPLACLANAQDTTVHVTYSTKAARTLHVLSDLQALSNVNLKATHTMEDEVLLISVKDLPLSDVMDRIAKVTSGEWKHEGATYQLVPSRAIQKLEDRQDEEKRVQDMRKAIDSRVKNNEDPSKAGGSKDSPPVVPAIPETPEEAIVTKLLQGVDVTVLADVAPGGRVVFSSDPTRTQHAFSGNSTEAINDFIQQHNASIANRHEDQDKQLNGLTQEQEAAIKTFTKKQDVRIGQVSKALLVATRMGLGVFNMTQLELRLYDSKGAVAYSSTSMLSMPGDDLSALIAAAVGKKTETGAAKQTPIDYSDDSKAFMQSTKGMTSGNFKLNLSPELHKKLMLPDKFDPLSFAASDELLSYAKSKGKPVVADIPDDAQGGLSAFMPGAATTVESFEKDLIKGKAMVLLPDQTFTVIKPANPTQSRADRLDRDALAALLKATDGKEIPSLDDLSTYAMHAPDPMMGGVGQMYLTLFVPGSSQQSIDGLTSWSMLRFYGHLSASSRASLRDGGRMLIGSFNAEQRACLEQMTYGALNQLQVEDPQHKGDNQPYWMKIISGSSGSDYLDEPTEVVPNGLPADGYVDLKTSNERFASPVSKDGSAMVAALGILGADELAIFKMFRDDKNYAQISAMLPSFGDLRIGQRTLLAFTFHLTPQVSVKQTLRDHHLPKDAPIVTESTLPDDFQKQIADKLDVFKKSPLGALGALMGAGRQAAHP